MSRFSYIKFDPLRADKMEAFKSLFEGLERSVEEQLTTSRPKSLCLTSLEEAYMWIGKAIRDEQIQLDGKINHEPNRG